MTRSSERKAGAVGLAAAVWTLSIACGPRSSEPLIPAAAVVARAAPLHATMDFESDRLAIRFGTPAARRHEAHGFEDFPADPLAEPSAAIRRRAEVWTSWTSTAPRAAILDLDLPPRSRFRALRVLLNGHRVARLELGPGRRRYRFEVPEARQRRGGNTMAFVFGAESGSAEGDAGRDPGEVGRAYGLVIGDAQGIDALDGAPLPFSTWPEGDSIVQPGASRLAWTLQAPARAGLRFTTVARHGAPVFHVEAEDERGKRAEIWRGGPGNDVEIAVPGGAGNLVRLWLGVDDDDGRPSWGAWKGLALTGAASPTPPPPPVPPIVTASRPRLLASSVLVLVLDAAGARHFGCYGHARPTTPNIDRIAAEGVLFERAYTPAVFTRSAMASVWTSQLPDEHHASISYDDPLPPGVPTLAAIASAHGVNTAAFVGNDMAGAAFGLDRGFAEFHRVSHRAHEARGAIHGWLAGNAQRRFLAYVHYREPHYPFDPPPPFTALFGPDAPLPSSVRSSSAWVNLVNEGTHVPDAAEIDHFERLYDANLAAVDHEVGLLRERLETLGLWDRTTIVLTADHGEAMYEHAHIGHNDQVYEESVHVPLVIRFPAGTLSGGRRVAALVGLLDVAPTVADVLGIPKARTATFRGRSLLAAAAGGPDTPPETLLARTVGARPVYALVGARYKYQYDTRDGDEKLYDLAADPREKASVVDAHLVRASYLRQRLFAALLAGPGRSGPSAAGWSVPAEQREALRALGYVQ